MTYKIIGISGAAQCGKDTAADHILTKRPAYQKISLADPIKAMLSAGLGLTETQLYGDLKDVIDERYGCTPRKMLQTLGTEWGRDLVHTDIWLLAMGNHLEQLGGTFIIPDIRFENEAKFVRENGVLIHIHGRLDGIKESDHSSEAGVTVSDSDHMILNDKDLAFYLDEVIGTLLMIESHW